MTGLTRPLALWSAFLEQSASAVALLVARHAARRRILVVESGGGELLLYAEGAQSQEILGRIGLSGPDAGVNVPGLAKILRGSHATIRLDPRRFVFRTLELPRRATDFLGAIVRAQIDRLTPWTSDHAAFGWSKPPPGQDGDRISLTVAATDKSLVDPLLQAIQDRGAGIVIASVAAPNGTATDPGIVVAQTASAAFDVAFWRRLLGRLSLVTALLAGAAGAYAWVTIGSLDATQERVAREIAIRRAFLLKQAAASSDPSAAGRQLLEQRKRDMPSVTLVIEALSRILPDDTYVTELQIDGQQLRIVGLTADAPTLVRLIEKSDLFSNATFFAPTTRLPEDPGDRFNIEVLIRPHAGPGP